MEAKLNPLFEAAVKDKSLPGVAAAIYDASGKALYSQAFGVNNLDDPSSKPFTTSTPLIMWSTTKVVTCVAALQLVEQGKLSIHDPAEKYVPDIAKIQVLDGVDSDGKFKYRAPSKKVTVLNLFTHTAGFSYDFFHEDTLKWRMEKGETPAVYVQGNRGFFETPLVRDPSAGYEYGVNIDWLGWIVEKISGLKLDVYVDKYIVKPLGLKKTRTLWGEGEDRLVVHMRGEEGKLTAAPDFVLPAEPEFFGGGHYLTSTVDDYCQFLLALINKGTHPGTGAKILEAKTVDEYLFKDFIPEVGCSHENVGVVGSAIPQLTATGTFLPGVELGWSCGMMINNADVKGGRKAGSGSWAGLGNLYYWVDPKGGRLGLIVTSVLPFFDETTLKLAESLEMVAYGGEVSGGGKTFSAP